jgi:hypothetical protein
MACSACGGRSSVLGTTAVLSEQALLDNTDETVTLVRSPWPVKIPAGAFRFGRLLCTNGIPSLSERLAAMAEIQKDAW